MITGIFTVTFLLLALIIATVIIITEARRRRLLADLKEADYKMRLNNATLTALRSQMNPHFIFNSLNSIKYYTEKNEGALASEYLTKFATLIRNTLDNADKEKITLEEEIVSLRSYLDLEAMRFKDKLRYSINVNDNVDLEFIEIPPMLIQPYAENALWHGLMPRESGGALEISFEQVDDTFLLIFIKDNGIGRRKSLQLKKQQLTGHKSHGIQITGSRIAMLNEKDSTANAEISVTDEYTATGESAGTTVKIKLPLK